MMRPAPRAPRAAEFPGVRSGELEAMAAIVSDLIRAGRWRPPAAPLPWPDLVLWFQREYAPGLRAPVLSAALRIALGAADPPSPDMGRGRLVRPAELSGDAMLARLVAYSWRALRVAPAGSFERLPDDVLAAACAYGSLLDWLSLRAAARRFRWVGQPFVRRCAVAFARANLTSAPVLVSWAVWLYGPWRGARAQRLANQLTAERAGFDRGTLFGVWIRGQWGTPPDPGSRGGPVWRAAICALRRRLSAASLAAGAAVRGWPKNGAP